MVFVRRHDRRLIYLGLVLWKGNPGNRRGQRDRLVSPAPPYGQFNEQMPVVSDQQLQQNLLDFIHVLNRSGLTSVYDVGRRECREERECWPAPRGPSRHRGGSRD